MSFNDVGDRKRTPLLAGAGSSQVPSLRASAQQVTDAVRKIQQCASEIQKETRIVNTARNAGGTYSRVEQLARDARQTAEQARRWLADIADASDSRSRAGQQTRLQHQKLEENLQSASRDVEARWAEYEVAASSRASRLEGAEMETFRPAQEQARRPLAVQDTEADVTDAVVETHLAIVQETAQDVTHLNTEIQTLNQAVRDLAQVAVEQGQSLDSIEGHMGGVVQTTAEATTQVQVASTTQQRGNKRLLYMLALVVALCVLLIIILAVKHS